MEKKTIIFIICLIVIGTIGVFILFEEKVEKTELTSGQSILGGRSSQVIESIDRVNTLDDLNYNFNKDGWVEIMNRFGKHKSYQGFGIEGIIDGEHKIVTTEDFEWTITKTAYLKNVTTYKTIIINETDNLTYAIDNSYIAYNLTAYNNKPNFNWTIDFNIEGEMKTKHTITNNKGSDITDAKFWYFATIPKDAKLIYGNKLYDVSVDEFDLEGEFNNIKQIRIKGYTFDYSDLIENNFDVVNLYLGDGGKIGHPNKRLIGIAVTKGSGTLSDGQTIKLDPTTTSFSSGTESGVPHADFTNSQNAGGSDNVYATTGTEGNNLSIFNFSLLDDEGGEVPMDAIIQGITYEVEADMTSGLGGTDAVTLLAGLSPDAGVTFFRNPDEFHIIVESSGEGFFPFGSSMELFQRRWFVNELTNENFQIVTGSGGMSGVNPLLLIDSGRVKVTYATAPITNVTERGLFGETQKWYQLSPLDNETGLNFNNSVYYLDFENVEEAGGINRTTNKFLFDIRATYINVSKTSGYLGNGVFFKDDGSAKTAFSIPRISLENQQINITLMAWVKSSPRAPGSPEVFFDKSLSVNPVTQVSWRMFKLSSTGFPTGNRNRLRFTAQNESGTRNDCTSLGIVPEDEWHHVAFTYNGTTRAIYIDGALDNTCTTLTGPLKTLGNIQLGSRSDESDSWDFFGTMDEFMYLDTALSETQIANLYGGDTRQFYPRGEWVFPERSIGTNTTLNLTIISEQPVSTSINISIGNSTAGDYVYGEEIDFSSETVNDIAIGTPSNYSYKIILYHDTIFEITPSVSEDFIEVSFGEPAAVSCTFDCSTNPVVTTNIDCLGDNLSIFGLGTMLLDGANITNYDNRFLGDGTNACIFTRKNGAVLTPLQLISIIFLM